MRTLIAIALGGGMGALLRYGLGGIIARMVDIGFPWGTLGVNLLGCFLVGFLWEICSDTVLAPHWRAFIFIGVLGGFTTFSSHSLESLNLLREGEVKLAGANILLSNGAGLILVFAGMVVADLLAKVIK